MNSWKSTVIQIRYELEVILDVEGFHTDLQLRIPLTIGDIPYGATDTSQFAASQPPPLMDGGFVRPQLGLPGPNAAFGYNPPTIAAGFAPVLHPSGASYPGSSLLPNVGTPYSHQGTAGVPYAEGTPQPANSGIPFFGNAVHGMSTYPAASSAPEPVAPHSHVYMNPTTPQTLNPHPDALAPSAPIEPNSWL